MKQGLLSVIIPVYNAEPYLAKCIDSVLSQDVPLEVLLIDDGSIDGSANVCKRYAERDTRIRYFAKRMAAYHRHAMSAWTICSVNSLLLSIAMTKSLVVRIKQCSTNLRLSD